MQRLKSPKRVKKNAVREKTRMIITVKKSSNNNILPKNNNNNNSTKRLVDLQKKSNRNSFFIGNNNDEKQNNFSISNNDENSSLVNYLPDDKIKEKENKNFEEQNKVTTNQNDEINETFTDSSFVNSDPEEIKNIFGKDGLKNENDFDTSNFFENSIDNSQTKTEQINETDLDPNIKEVLILFVLNQKYYELLIQERAKKAFSIDIRKKYK